MRLIKYFLIVLSFISYTSYLHSAEISRIEPPSWWSGMNNPNLQIMLYGVNLKGSNVITKERGIEITSVENADSPDYLFVNIKISPKLKAGGYKFTLINKNETIDFIYQIGTKGNSGVYTGKGFNSEDMVYLLMPDRFINGDSSNDSHSDAIEKSNSNNKYGRYGGDILGMINSLKYLKNLGVTKIWLLLFYLTMNLLPRTTDMLVLIITELIPDLEIMLCLKSMLIQLPIMELE